MTFGPKRGHFLFIFDSFFKDFGLLIIAILIGFFKGNFVESILDNMGILAVLFIMPLMRVAEYLTTRITVTPQKIKVTSGIFVKTDSEIPAAAITTIDYSQNLLHQLFKVYRIKIENSSNMSSENEGNKVKMVFSAEDMECIRNILGRTDNTVDGANIAPGSDEDTGRNRKIRIPAGKLVQMGLLKSKVSMAIEGVSLLIVGAGFLSEKDMDHISDMVLSLTAIGIAIAISVLITGLLVLEIAISVIRYYNFTITDKGDVLNVEYGLFTKKSYSLVKSRISGFSYEQPLLMRMMHKGTLNVFAVGFGNDDEANSTSMIHPLLSESMLREFMAEFTDRFSTPCEIKKASAGSFRYFFYRPVFISTVIITAVAFIISAVNGFWWPLFISIALVVLSGAGRVMEKKNTMAGGNEREILIASGGYTKVWTFIKTDNAEKVESTGSKWKRSRGIIDITVDFLGLSSITSCTAYNVDEDIESRLKGLLTY